MLKTKKDKVFIKLKDLENGKISKPIGIRELIFDQDEIEFEWSNGGTLPYKDFLYFQNEYEVIIVIKPEVENDN